VIRVLLTLDHQPAGSNTEGSCRLFFTSAKTVALCGADSRRPVPGLELRGRSTSTSATCSGSDAYGRIRARGRGGLPFRTARRPLA
jgi:hypothetical protein